MRVSIFRVNPIPNARSLFCTRKEMLMTDLIKRSDAIEAIRKLPNAGIKWYVSAEAVFDVLLTIPSADRPQGEWILECDAEGEGDNLYRCSECGQGYGCQEYDLPNYCPNCGAKMFAKGINVPNKKGADDEASD